jgi:hypothetical protein
VRRKIGRQVQSGNLGRILAELRRSNAAGKHGPKSPDRYNKKKRYIDQERRDNE